jgi:hypothetical protein
VRGPLGRRTACLVKVTKHKNTKQTTNYNLDECAEQVFFPMVPPVCEAMIWAIAVRASIVFCLYPKTARFAR